MKNLLESQIGEVWIEGEISNLRKQGSGHWYFTLKDEGAQIQCAMFGARKRLGADIMVDGSKVRVLAEASVYEARGQLQVIVQKAELAGFGDLQAKFEKLKHKLKAEGLFDVERKIPIPLYPKVIGIVTSPSAAALQDILNVLSRRAPWVQPVLLPVRVQGRGAELEIATAIRKLGDPERFGYPKCDVLIVGRGGGSIEDLWNFNEEVVARAIAACPIPIISAVGHEIDFTIADFVADLRAPTPSAAAELAVADGTELRRNIQRLHLRMHRSAMHRMTVFKDKLDHLKRGVLQRDADRILRESIQRVDNARDLLVRSVQTHLTRQYQQVRELQFALRANHPAKVMDRRNESLARLKVRMVRAAEHQFNLKSDRLKQLRSLLRTLGPESAFQRGFSIALTVDGKVVTSSISLNPGETLRTKFSDGETRSVVCQ